MKITVLFAFLLLFLPNAFAQNTGKIEGTVLQNAAPAEGATVSLLRAKDSATVKLSVAGKEGLYAFENIAEGRYLISVTQWDTGKPIQRRLSSLRSKRLFNFRPLA
jgi:iron complex outermembrane recepter protein